MAGRSGAALRAARLAGDYRRWITIGIDIFGEDARS